MAGQYDPQFIDIYEAPEFVDIYRKLIDERQSPRKVYQWLRDSRGIDKARPGPPPSNFPFTINLLRGFYDMMQSPSRDAALAYVLKNRQIQTDARVQDLESLDFVIKRVTEDVVFDPDTQYDLSDLYKALEVKTKMLNSAGFLALMSQLHKAEGLSAVVDAVTFAEDERFCNQELFEWQRETLQQFFQPQLNYNELVCIMGMGSGKGLLGSIIAWYCAYQLLSLEDPQKYWGFAPGQEIIACLNMATSEDQAESAVFKHIRDRMEHGGEWFQTPGLIQKVKQFEIQLDKNIIIKCGHSRATQLVGGTVFCVVFDEISKYKNTDGTDNAEDVYSKLRGSTKRFGHFARSVEISSPEWDGDMGMRLLRQAQSGEFPRMLPIHMSSWEASPLITFEALADDFRRNPRAAARDYGAEPPTAQEAFFRNRKLVEASSIQRRLPLNEDGTFASWFSPCCDGQRYVHVDLAESRDACGIVMAHVPTEICPHRTRKVPIMSLKELGFDIGDARTGHALVETQVFVDLMLRIEARDDDIDFGRVRQLIYDLQALGFDIKSGGVTYDRWQSADSIQQLKKSGYPAALLSVDRTTQAYDTLLELLSGAVLDFYNLTWDAVPPAPTSVVEELLQLQLKNGNKVEHSSFGCFTGDTRVALLDGTNPTFEELVERYGDGAPFHVYSIGSQGELTVGTAKKPRVTRRNVEIVDVELDQGIHIRCTPDHLFMLRDGSYCRADALAPETSLMPLYRSYSENHLHEFGYERVWTPHNDRIKTHWLVSDHLGLCRRNGRVIHHVDGNKRNNSPGNLVSLSKSKHAALHANKSWSTKEDAVHEGHKKYVEGGGGEISRTVIARSWKNGKFKRQMECPRARTDVTFDSICSQMPAGISKIARNLGCGNSVIVSRVLWEGFANWRAFVKWCTAGQPPRNHIVLSVTPVGFADVYDFEVEEHHNFALACGVFVHNSKDVADALAGATLGCILGYRRQGKNVDTLAKISIDSRLLDETPRLFG